MGGWQGRIPFSQKLDDRLQASSKEMQGDSTSEKLEFRQWEPDPKQRHRERSSLQNDGSVAVVQG